MVKNNLNQKGTILIIVAGISALLASMSLVFLTRMRSDISETNAIVREAQARIMLSAACSYIQEASRLGYDFNSTKNTDFHPEGYGWIDVRDGAIGPKPSAIPATTNPVRFFNTSASTGTTPHSDAAIYSFRNDNSTIFPIGAARRFDMFMKTIPPFAIRLDAAPNPIDPQDGIPFLSRPDPVPVLPREFNWSNPSNKDFNEFERGDPRPVSNSLGLAWFRLFRLGAQPHPNFSAKYPDTYKQYNPATFIVTVGAGATGGFRFFGTPPDGRPIEMTSADEQRFGTKENFIALQSEELRYWYLVEWSPAVGGQFLFNTIHHRDGKYDANGEHFAISQYAQFPQNKSRYSHSQGKLKNFGGTIRFIQRLKTEPPEW